jgi:MerR family transcriptional regulator, light-induced transcriptional regulator
MNTQISERLDHESPHIVRYVMRQMISKNICDIKKARETCERDVKYIIQYLAQAVEFESPLLFRDFTAWLTDLLVNKNIPVDHLKKSYRFIREGIEEILSDTSWADPYFDVAENCFNQVSVSTADTIIPSDEVLLGKYVRYLINAERNQARKLVLKELNAGRTPRDIYMNIFEPAQHVIGRLWQTNIISVAQEHYATAVTQMIMSELYPHIFTSRKNGYKMAAFCVGSELHELGIRMVTDFFEMEGWDTSFYGANTPVPDMLKTLHEETYELIALSTTMMVHLKPLYALLQKIREDNRFQEMKILVGGYPFLVDEELWKKVGADGSARNAESALKLTSEWFQFS